MADVYIVTEEPYHENSSVLLATDDRGAAIAAFEDAPNKPPANEYDPPDSWVIQAWRAGCRGRELSLCRKDLHVLHAGQIVYRPDPDSRDSIPTDPRTFEFFD
jgi:hypothetical protein